MANIVGRIVLTGGPCAGKTTALARIEQDLTEKGFYPLIVSESATELIKGGIKPFGMEAINLVDFQRLILTYQLNKERTYEEAIKLLPNNAKCVLIYDRGIMDNKAYITNQEFKTIITELGLEEIELLDRYDLVIHLVTAADGKEDYYTLDNNNARTETKEEAKALDKKTRNAWNGHNNLIIIDNEVNFEEKISKVLTTIHNFLNTPVSLKKQELFTVDLDSTIIPSVSPITIEQYYIKDEKCEKRLRKRTMDGRTTYYYTAQKRANDGLSKILTDKKLTEKEFERIKNASTIDAYLKKTRYCFSENKIYFKLDVFDSNTGILQVDTTVENPHLSIPNNVKIIENVTNNPEYQSYNLAQKELHLLRKVKK